VSGSPERVARIGHSPDPDDAFMFWGIVSGRVDTRGFSIEQVLDGIEGLNRRCLSGELEVSAISIHAWAHVAERYALMPCGASMGDGYGPLVVAREPLDRRALARSRIAIPGSLTSAALALRLYLGSDYDHVVVPFDRIMGEVASGRVAAGLLIHEGQLTYGDAGLLPIVDLGRFWAEHTGGLPLPLGGNVVRRDLGERTMRELTSMLLESIEAGLAEREAALDYAIEFGRDLDRPLTDRFVGMYVNELTRDYGQRGRAAIERFLAEGARAGVVPPVPRLEFVG
jgi:1,4-dihydroxy-6-naphthoate synthase